MLCLFSHEPISMKKTGLKDIKITKTSASLESVSFSYYFFFLRV